MELNLRGKVALVTGGSMGIGKACVEAFAREGVRVATCARGIDLLKQVTEEVSSKTEVEVLPIKADVTKTEEVHRFVTAAAEHYGRVDILVNNAVNFSHGAFLELPDEAWLNHFDTKVLGYLRCAKEVLPYLRKQRWGRIISMAGGAARSSTPEGTGMTAGATNAAVINFTKVLSDDVAKDGITVNAIHPSARGLGWQRRLEETAKRLGISIEEANRQMMQRQAERPGPRAEAEDAANMVLFLSSDRAAAITGQVIAVASGGQGVYY